MKAEETFTCLENGVSDRVPPPIEDLEEQQAVIDRVNARDWPFTIKLLEPSLLGPVALIDGGYEAALAAEPILAEAGVPVVYRYDAGPEDGDKPDHGVAQALGWKLDEAQPLVSRVVRRAPGYVDMWVWPAAGSLQLFWHGEIPTEVQALVGTLPNGARVDPITQVPYSIKVLRRAQNAATDALADGFMDVKWASSALCHDYRGVIVGAVEKDPARREEVGRALTELVGIPVMVVYGEPASPA